MDGDSLSLLQLSMDSSKEVNTYWNLYIAVATAVVGIMAAGHQYTNSKILKIILSGAFLVFAISNLLAIIRLGNLRMALINAFPDEFKNNPELMAGLMPADWLSYTAFHGFLDIAVIAAIWAVPWFMARESGADIGK
ncbi:hypothetical protein IWQ55_000851 [Labrenzia sp. EL_208]|nr:hypothetical protein [Labrenzia sp. EL_132]MBG6227653.1 hypothetical protein [Labrenzia sp. EL_208]